MNHRKLRSRFLAAATVGVAAITTALTLGVGAAYAGSGPYSVSTGVGPRWNLGHPEMIRSAGSDTTFFLSQTIANYFEQSGLYGCQLDSAVSPNYSSCINAPGDVIATTDTTDNYDHVEVTVGLGKIGSGDGQKQLCGAETAPFPVDYSRSSKPVSSSNGCSTMVGLGFGKDGVPAVDFPGSEGTGVATDGAAVAAGALQITPTAMIVGPVAAGWLPGDPITCDTGAANSSTNTLNRTTNPNVGILADSCSGVPFENVNNNDGVVATANESTAYRLWCDPHTGGTSPITDWGQLTNITGTTPVGQGTPIGVKIVIQGVNTGSGTEATFDTFANSSASSGACSGSSGNVNVNTFNSHVSLENNSAQFGDFAASDFSGDATDQAAELSASLYFISNGVYNSNVHAREATIKANGVVVAANKMLENGVVPTTTVTGTLMTNGYPTARTLYNVYRTDTVRASVADYLDWWCDSNNLFQKGTDLYTGKNYDQEITNAINTTYGFIRLTDTTAAPNNSCQMITSVANPNT
jgi:hypothetical protein